MLDIWIITRRRERLYRHYGHIRSQTVNERANFNSSRQRYMAYRLADAFSQLFWSEIIKKLLNYYWKIFG